jgi:hypothetical protein
MILYKYTTEAGLTRFLETRRLRFSPPTAFNDPFESRPAIATDDELARELEGWKGHEALGIAAFDFDFPFGLRRHLADLIGTRVGILCLTEDPCHPLMWSHYADSHKGAVIGFDVAHPFFADTGPPGPFTQFLTAVQYSMHRSTLTAEFFRKHPVLGSDGTGWLELLQSRHPLFFTKSEHWQYEKEWRLVRQLASARETVKDGTRRRIEARTPGRPSKEQLIEIPAAAVASITLGTRSRRQGWGDTPGMEEDLIALLKAHPELSHVELWKVRPHSRDFSLMRFNLDSRSDLEKNVHPQEMVARREGFQGRPPRKP